MSKEMDRAVELRSRTDIHYNCAQTVLCAFADTLGMTEEEAFKLGSHFGGGMKMGATCGVITSGLMILGMAGKGETAVANKYVDGFRERHNGVLNCAELLRINAEKGGTRKPHCDGMVYEAVAALEEMLK
jgi:C_GCAxxG_C_C family probable redox protein